MNRQATTAEEKQAKNGSAVRPQREPQDHEALAPYADIMMLHRQAGNRAVETVLRGQGRPLPQELRRKMEQRFGEDFSQVLLHDDVDAAASAEAISAKAYTVGNHIVFNHGRFSPGTDAGKRLLAHEIAHVIQQTRGGTIRPEHTGSGPLEKAATDASRSFIETSGPVTVQGSSAPGVALDRKDDWEQEERRRKMLERKRAKTETQQRKEERERAGKSEQQIANERALKELERLEREAKTPGVKSRSQKSKEQLLNRYETVLKNTDLPHLEKNERKGAFDEALRTPGEGRTAGPPQTKSVAGHAALPGQELRPGKESYAQPDYSIYRRTPDGRLKRFHVNLKSNQLHKMTPADARAAAKYNTDQAVRNAVHLAEGETIIISYARTPSKEVQETMLAEHFRKGSPISEVRFGSATYKRSEYHGPAKSTTTLPKTKKQKKTKSTASHSEQSPKKGSVSVQKSKPGVPPAKLNKKKQTASAPQSSKGMMTGATKAKEASAAKNVQKPLPKTKLQTAQKSTSTRAFTAPKPSIRSAKPIALSPPKLSFRAGAKTAGGIAASVAFNLLDAWLQQKNMERMYEKEMQQKVEPEIQRRLSALEEKALEMQIQSPDQDIYAVISMTTTILTNHAYNVGPAHEDIDSSLYFGTEVTSVELSHRSVQKEREETDRGFFRDITKQSIVYSMPLEKMSPEDLVAYAKEKGLGLDALRKFTLSQIQSIESEPQEMSIDPVLHEQYRYRWQSLLQEIDAR